MLCVRHTGQRADHGERGEGAGQPLSTHDGGGVGGGQNPSQPEQTALKNRPECCGGTRKNKTTMFKNLFTLKSHYDTEKTNCPTAKEKEAHKEIRET